jgi:hypothetical protein
MAVVFSGAGPCPNISSLRGCFSRPLSSKVNQARIPDAADAVAAVRSECGAGPDTIIEPVVEFPSGTDPRNGKSFAMT